MMLVTAWLGTCLFAVWTSQARMNYRSLRLVTPLVVSDAFEEHVALWRLLQAGLTKCNYTWCWATVLRSADGALGGQPGSVRHERRFAGGQMHDSKAQ